MENTTLKFKDYTVEIPDGANLKEIYIEITSKCNLNCKMCFRRFWKDKVLDMPKDKFLKILDDLKAFPKLETVYIGGIGEPLMHPNILEIIENVKSRGLRIELGTNGTLLHELSEDFVRLNVDRVTVSIDAPDPAVYRDIRGTDFASVESNVLFLQEVKKREKSSKPNVAIEVVAMKSNVLVLPNILPLASKLGINDILISNLMPFSEELSKEIIYDGSLDWEILIEVMNSQVGKYRVNINFPKFELLTERMCKFIEKDSTVIRADGEVAPCYRLLHSYTEYVFGRKKEVNAYSFGNAFEKPIYEIWNGKEYKVFRYNVKNSLYPSCTDCLFKDTCDFAKTANSDCFGNLPSCVDCLWSRRIIQCP